jgi:hypothetical protein
VSVLFTFANTALLHVNGYLGSFNPAAVSSGWAGDNGGSASNGAGTAQLFSFNVPAGQTFVVVVSESNQNGGLNVPYNLRVTGLPSAAVPANLPPVNAVPGPQSVPANAAFPFTGAKAISITDPDAGLNPVKVTLTVTNGTFNLNGTTGLSFEVGDGTNDTTMTFTGALAAINGALNNSSYVSNLDYSGPANINVAVDDLGNVGAGNNQSDSDNIVLSVLAPTAARVAISGRVSNADGLGISGATVSYSDGAGHLYNGRTNAFGYYLVEGVPAGLPYIGTVRSKLYTFQPRLFNVMDPIADGDFVANP